MFKNDKLQEHLETSSSISSQPAVIAEWNMNFAENIATIGNYRYRPSASPESDDFVFSFANNVFDPNDAENEVKFYDGATDADIVVAGGLDDRNEPIAFVSDNEKERLLYSLENCFYRFRPRSGINKLRYFPDRFTHHTNSDMANRPRYYMSSRDDQFKYWTSYRREKGVERGIANIRIGSEFYIDDAAPFVVYKEEIPTNKIVVKMQTHVGSVDLGPFLDGAESFDDPFFGEQNKAVPSNWRIQYLKENNWVDAFVFDPLTFRPDGSPAIKEDGYVEISYGLIVPEQYSSIFYLVSEISTESLLPDSPPLGSSYLVGAEEDSAGSVYLWDGEKYISFTANYGWFLSDEGVNDNTPKIKNLSNAPKFVDESSGKLKYREFENIRGIRVVVETMNVRNSTFDLIEISPRLVADLTDKTKSFRLNKSASDLGVSGMPVGQLLASTGALSLFDYDESFNPNNENSVIGKFLKTSAQIKLYDVIYNFEKAEDPQIYYVPIKYMYVDSFPEIDNRSRSVDLELRDLFFYFESRDAPPILVENASVSYAVSFLLDSIGFSNYKFLRVDGQDDPVIPYFFVAPDKSVAQILQEIAVSTQTAMFFDEFNNFVLMTKDYMMPKLEDRATDLVLRGSPDQVSENVFSNKATNKKLANIEEVSSSDSKIYNDGKINYTTRYIQKTYGSLKQASVIDKDKTWIYRPVLLWEVGGEPLARSRDEEEIASSFALSAIPLNSDLSERLPNVVNNEMRDNVLDFGEGVYWLGRYNGYFYANGEIIRFDAVEYAVSGIGNVWISSVREYQNYFSKIPFNGKIYPTGRVKIYAEPDFEEVNGVTIMSNGPVAKHGRGQFGTPVVFHPSGLDPYWSDSSANAPVGGVEMDSSYLFGQNLDSLFSAVYNEGTNRGRVLAIVQDEENIFSVAYGNSVWTAAGDGGKFRVSDNGVEWQTITDPEIDSSFVFNSVEYGLDEFGQGIWAAVGSREVGGNTQAAFVTSSDRINWTVRNVVFESKVLKKIKFLNGLWVILGENSEIKTSTNLSSWQTLIPNFDRSPRSVTAIEQYPAVEIQSISQESPAIFVVNDHNLIDGDKIRLSTTGSLPQGIQEATDYYVEVIDESSFVVSETLGGIGVGATSAGSGQHSFRQTGAIMVSNNHGMSDDSVFHIVTNEVLPDGIESKKLYYVRLIDENRVAFSQTLGGELVDFVDSRSDVAYQMNRFNEASINAVAFGNGRWVIAGDNGRMAFAVNLNSWFAIDPGFGSSRINDLIFANNTWVAVADSGKIRTSTNSTTWFSRTSPFGFANVNSVAFGNALFVAVGDGSRVATSPDGNFWTPRNSEFNADIYAVARGNVWLVAGEKLQIRSSQDAFFWEDRTTDNAGEILFRTISPHNLVPFDYVRFYSNGVLPADKPKEPKQLSSISIGSPAIFERNNHGLQNDEEIRLFSTGRLPAGLSTGQTYYVQVINSNSFNVKESPGGGLVGTSGDPEESGSHSFSTLWVDGLEEDTRYFVTAARISENTFTIAKTREEARQGITVTAGGSQLGQHSVVLDNIPDFQQIGKFDGNIGDQMVVEVSGDSGLGKEERVFFAVRSGDEFVDSELPNGLIRYAEYWVKEVISENRFTISESIGGPPVVKNDIPGQLGENEQPVVVKNAFKESLLSNIVVPLTTTIRRGSSVERASGLGSLDSPTRVSAIRNVQRLTRTIDSISQGSPATFVVNSHGLFSGDNVRLSTTGFLPAGIEANRNYSVQKIDDDSFALFSVDGRVPVSAFDEENQGRHIISKNLNYSNKVTISPAAITPFPKTDEPSFEDDVVPGSLVTEIFNENSIRIVDRPTVVNIPTVENEGRAGFSQANKELARSSSRNGIIKNFLAKTAFSETEVNRFYSTQAGTIQSSALVFNGPSFGAEIIDQNKRPIDFLSYVYKPLKEKFTHFGTRLRIIGRMENEDRLQSAFNAINYYQTLNEDLGQLTSFSGGSAGLAVMLNPETNMGYYFEIIALNESNVDEFGGSDGIYNVIFYKVAKKVAEEGEPEVSDDSPAIPVRLWAGATSVLTDNGTLVGQFRMVNEEKPSVYDIAVEYEDLDATTRRFYLYFNNRVLAVVDDKNPLPVYNNAAMFVRGSARAMFENFYALSNNYSQNTISPIDTPINSVFGAGSVNVSESFRKYAMSGLVQSTYLSGIGTKEPPKHNIYFEEFGTIMREAAYFNIRYDKAYPALYAQISPTFNKMKSYTVSGFVPSAYGAEFLIFNHTDTAISLDETSGNYLRIQGVTFTQESEKELTVDEYFANVSNFSNPKIQEDGTILSPVVSKQQYQDIRVSRITNGVFEFNLQAPYIQNQDSANDLMKWIIDKTSSPRRSVGLKVFGLPILQLGDIVEIDYSNKQGNEEISLSGSRFVVYNIEYNRSARGPSMNVFCSEVV